MRQTSAIDECRDRVADTMESRLKIRKSAHRAGHEFRIFPPSRRMKTTSSRLEKPEAAKRNPFRVRRTSSCGQYLLRGLTQCNIAILSDQRSLFQASRQDIHYGDRRQPKRVRSGEEAS